MRTVTITTVGELRRALQDRPDDQPCFIDDGTTVSSFQVAPPRRVGESTVTVLFHPLADVIDRIHARLEQLEDRGGAATDAEADVRGIPRPRGAPEEPAPEPAPDWRDGAFFELPHWRFPLDGQGRIKTGLFASLPFNLDKLVEIAARLADERRRYLDEQRARQARKNQEG